MQQRNETSGNAWRAVSCIGWSLVRSGPFDVVAIGKNILMSCFIACRWFRLFVHYIKLICGFQNTTIKKRLDKVVITFTTKLLTAIHWMSTRAHFCYCVFFPEATSAGFNTVKKTVNWSMIKYTGKLSSIHFSRRLTFRLGLIFFLQQKVEHRHQAHMFQVAFSELPHRPAQNANKQPVKSPSNATRIGTNK